MSSISKKTELQKLKNQTILPSQKQLDDLFTTNLNRSNLTEILRKIESKNPSTGSQSNTYTSQANYNKIKKYFVDKLSQKQSSSSTIPTISELEESIKISPSSSSASVPSSSASNLSSSTVPPLPSSAFSSLPSSPTSSSSIVADPLVEAEPSVDAASSLSTQKTSPAKFNNVSKFMKKFTTKPNNTTTTSTSAATVTSTSTPNLTKPNSTNKAKGAKVTVEHNGKKTFFTVIQESTENTGAPKGNIVTSKGGKRKSCKQKHHKKSHTRRHMRKKSYRRH
jgi:hypothetical protein